MDQIWKRIEAVAEQNNGFIRTSQVEELGISRPMLRKYTDAGKLKQSSAPQRRPIAPPHGCPIALPHSSTP